MIMAPHVQWSKLKYLLFIRTQMVVADTPQSDAPMHVLADPYLNFSCIQQINLAMDIHQ